jgi:hypothetical protein
VCGEDLEDELSGRRDSRGERAQGTDASTDAEIDGDRASHEEDVDGDAERAEAGDGETPSRGHVAILREPRRGIAGPLSLGAARRGAVDPTAEVGSA